MVARPMIESPYKVDIPATDVASFIFNSGTPTSRQAPQYFDAASPSKCFSFSEAEVFVKQAAKRLEALGLQPDDKVLLFSHNRLFFPSCYGVYWQRAVFSQPHRPLPLLAVRINL